MHKALNDEDFRFMAKSKGKQQELAIGTPFSAEIWSRDFAKGLVVGGEDKYEGVSYDAREIEVMTKTHN